MKQLFFATGNNEKFTTANEVCRAVGIELLQEPVDIDEIQGEDPEKIVRDKAQKAFAIHKQPVLVSDDIWQIPGLNGFPGAYMKSINSWFSAEDFLRLTTPLTDRRAILTAYLAYTDGKQVKTFAHSFEGTLLTEAKGHYGSGWHKVVSMNGDNGLSIAEIYDKNTDHTSRYLAAIWQDFATWFNAQS